MNDDERGELEKRLAYLRDRQAAAHIAHMNELDNERSTRLGELARDENELDQKIREVEEQLGPKEAQINSNLQISGLRDDDTNTVFPEEREQP